MISCFSNVPFGYLGFLLADFVRKHRRVCFIASSDKQLDFLHHFIPKITPNLPISVFPAWNTVPYDRIDPDSDIIAEQMTTLAQLRDSSSPLLLLTTAAALGQKIPVLSTEDKSLYLKTGQEVSFEKLPLYLTEQGYRQVSLVMNKGEYALRGGLIDIFPAQSAEPVRLDFFGDTLESIKTFDPASQKTTVPLNDITLTQTTPLVLNDKNTALFRSALRDLFPQQYNKSPLYAQISEHLLPAGALQFLPLFYEKMTSFISVAGNMTWVWYDDLSAVLDERDRQINEYYTARCEALKNLRSGEEAYLPLPPEKFYLSKTQVLQELAPFSQIQISPLSLPNTTNINGGLSYDFTALRKKGDGDIFSLLADYIRQSPKKIILSVSSPAAAVRLKNALAEKNLNVPTIQHFFDKSDDKVRLIVSALEQGFQVPDFMVLTENDIFGEHIIRAVPKKRKQDHFIGDIMALNIGTLVVHQTHGIGRFLGLQELVLNQAHHDCLALEYAGGDKLFIPVENADVLSLYGSGEGILDKMGGSFLSRKARVKKDLLIMAQQLIDLACARQKQKITKIEPVSGLYQEFCAQFPYAETDDQLRTMQEIESDLALGYPMDRLVCGDVGFGKTEMALRAAFLVVMAGFQVVVVVPTTLLATQHYHLFQKRFAPFPVQVGCLCRLTPPATARDIKTKMRDGTMDIVIGTHAILSKTLEPKNLGLIVIDEEQHFGVKFKEHLKELSLKAHLLTLTATPIPRTLQLSLAGAKELSIIATPPVDRIAVTTFIMPFDKVIIKEAVLREKFRGGQTFFVCPRIADLAEVKTMLQALLPDISLVVAHGQMKGTELENIMQDFTQGKYDILLTTSIIESGLDFPKVNTIIVYQADKFGLAALYQMRGRVGRGKIKAYAYFTTATDKTLTDDAHKRLEVLQNLDTLGAGFTLASHDLDIRGAGNLLGDKQSGHIKEVGIALYQQMLNDAIQNHDKTNGRDNDFSPQISLGLDVLIPATYINDLDTRMDIYRRLGNVVDTDTLQEITDELTDRFGPYPQEVDNLLQTVQLKIMAHHAHIERIDMGDKGGLVSLYQNFFPQPDKLMTFVLNNFRTMKFRPDQKIVLLEKDLTPPQRLKSVHTFLTQINQLLEN